MNSQTQISNNGPSNQTNVSNIPSSPSKNESRVESILAPSPGLMKKLVPLATFFMAFATVMTVLMLYMDNTALKHYQFRVNMSQDLEFLGVNQDDPQLIIYIREIFLSPAIEHHHKPIEFDASGPNEDVAYALNLLKNKRNGFYVEAGAYNDGKTSKTEWLEKKLFWKGLLIQPDPRHFFSLKRHLRVKSQAAHACLSPTPYPKEVTLHHDHDGVKINSILSNNLVEEPDWFNTRIKCFPLYSFLLAVNTTVVDYFSLESAGTELLILETIPYDQVKIKVISITLDLNDSEKNHVIDEFLKTKNYVLMKTFNNTYIYLINQ